LSELPFIDEHATDVEAPPAATWEALTASSAGAGHLPTAVAQALGCEQTRVAGSPGAVGSTVPGFRVVRAQPPRELALEGRHRFSRYRLTFRVDELAHSRSRLRAETRALFPGLRGSLYRTAVIGTRGHVLATTRILRAIRRRAERVGVSR
jgi:hypothetical protein